MPPRRHLTPNHADQPRDDFQKINGIGPVVAQRLQDAGILTYEDLTRRAPEEIAAAAGKSPESIVSQNWIVQAREFAEPSPEPSVPRQHYAAFHVEFLLESDNRVRRTKVRQHQTDVRDAWPGWDEERLIAFLRDRISLETPARPLDALDVEPPLMRSPNGPSISVPSAPASQPSPAASAEELPSSFLAIEELTSTRNDQRSYVSCPDEPNFVRLTLHVNRINMPIPDAFNFSATIAARKLASRDRVRLGTSNGIIRVGEPLSVQVVGPPLLAGLYRLVVTVDIYPADHATGEAPLYSHDATGNLLQVADTPEESSWAAA